MNWNFRGGFSNTFSITKNINQMTKSKSTIFIHGHFVNSSNLGKMERTLRTEGYTIYTPANLNHSSWLSLDACINFCPFAFVVNEESAMVSEPKRHREFHVSSCIVRKYYPTLYVPKWSLGTIVL